MRSKTVRARMLPCYRAYNAVMKALAQAVPERAIASGFDNALITCLARLADGRYRVCLETYGGGFGASSTAAVRGIRCAGCLRKTRCTIWSRRWDCWLRRVTRTPSATLHKACHPFATF